MLLEKNIKWQLRLRHVALIVGTLFLAFLASVFVYASQVKAVDINYKGKIMNVKTMGKTVGDVLRENEIQLNSNEIVKPNLDYILGSLTSIAINNAVLKAELLGSQKSIEEAKNLVVSINKEVITKDEGQKAILKNKENRLEKVVKIKVKQSFRIERKENIRMNKGKTKVVRQGKEGVAEKSYLVVYRDGKEVSRKYLNSKVITKPVNELIEYGTVAVLLTSRGDTLRYKRCIEMRASAYDNSYASTGKSPGHPGYGITASGMRTRPGVVAVDPRVIPLGSRLYIESMQNGVPSYGRAVAADTGGAIKGNKIDLFFKTSREVNNWGVRKVKVYVLE